MCMSKNIKTHENPGSLRRVIKGEIRSQRVAKRKKNYQELLNENNNKKTSHKGSQNEENVIFNQSLYPSLKTPAQHKKENETRGIRKIHHSSHHATYLIHAKRDFTIFFFFLFFIIEQQAFWWWRRNSWWWSRSRNIWLRFKNRTKATEFHFEIWSELWAQLLPNQQKDFL